MVDNLKQGEPTARHKLVAEAAAEAFGAGARVHRYWDNAGTRHVGVVSCVDHPVRGVTSFATVGMSDVSFERGGRRVGAELVGACSTVTEDFPNYLASAAFGVLRSGAAVAPGTILEGVLEDYPRTGAMVGWLLVSPFLWGGRLRTVQTEEGSVAWLTAVPITEGERRLARRLGPDALQDVFERVQIDVYDLGRPSAV